MGQALENVHCPTRDTRLREECMSHVSKPPAESPPACRAIDHRASTTTGLRCPSTADHLPERPGYRPDPVHERRCVLPGLTSAKFANAASPAMSKHLCAIRPRVIPVACYKTQRTESPVAGSAVQDYPHRTSP